jgi:hypothetical protein
MSTHGAANRPGLVVAFWGLALVLGRVQVSQTDKKSDGTIFGSILNHVTVGRFTDGECSLAQLPCPGTGLCHISCLCGIVSHTSSDVGLLNRRSLLLAAAAQYAQ